METIKSILIRRDGMSDAEADRLIFACKEDFYQRMEAGDIWGADDICGEYFGLEPDYLEELVF